MTTLSAAAISGRTPRDVSPMHGYASFELFVGTIQLVIIGPNEKDWLRVSAPDFTPGKTGTPEERSVARRAVEILNRDHRKRVDNTMPAMIKAWRRAAVELGYDPDKFISRAS